MPDATFHFPTGFLWGSATASHQVEGNNTNNQWWQWEQQPGRILQGHRSGLACDWWGGRWQEDFDRAAADGQNAHRFSVEWSRIQPTPDRWDESALEQYRQMLRGLLERNMQPMVTLHHFSDPTWLTEQGGWENPEVVEKFIRYVRKVVEGLKEYTNLWCTINEPNGYALLGYVSGEFPPGKHDIKLAMRVMANMVKAHAAAYHAIHDIQTEARVGFAWNYRLLEPAKPWWLLDRLVTRINHLGINVAFPSALSTGVMRSPLGKVSIPEAKGTQDYFGLNYYYTMHVKFDLSNPAALFSRSFFPAGSDLSDSGNNANFPQGFYKVIQWAVRTYPNLPILITENGIDCRDDHMRPRFIAQHIHQMWRAVNFNWPVKGYFHWTQVDNFEWERGWTNRFGLWELDTLTQERRKRPSADLYAEICKENGLSSHMVRKYCPEVFEKLFPG